MAEVARTYSNFAIPPLHSINDLAPAPSPTLVDQSAGLSNLLPATDAEPAETAWRSVWPYMPEAVQLYQAGYSLTAIQKKLGIGWDSVARLDKAGVRERRKKAVPFSDATAGSASEVPGANATGLNQSPSGAP
jgi:hypothetical protein